MAKIISAQRVLELIVAQREASLEGASSTVFLNMSIMSLSFQSLTVSLRKRMRLTLSQPQDQPVSILCSSYACRCFQIQWGTYRISVGCRNWQRTFLCHNVSGKTSTLSPGFDNRNTRPARRQRDQLAAIRSVQIDKLAAIRGCQRDMGAGMSGYQIA